MIPALVKELGGSFNKTAGTTLAHTFTATTSPGNLIVARILFDNFTTASKPVVSSITKMAGETANWVFLGAARSTSTSAGAFASGEMWCIQTTVAWSAAAYTVTLDSSVTQKAMAFTEFSGVQAVTRSTTGTAYSTTTTAASASTTGTTPVIDDLALGFIFGSNVAAAQAGDNDTTGGSWSTGPSIGSTGGNAATNNFGIGQYKVLTAASHQTYNNQAALTAGNGAIVAILQSIPDPTLTQAAYRFYADGTETASTALAAQDTAPVVDLDSGDVNLQLRTRLQSTTLVAVQPTDDFRLQWEKNGSGTWTNVVSSEPLLDSYPQSNQDDFISLYSARTVSGQTFLGNGQRLSRARFYLKKTGSPAGTITSSLYNHAGTFGSGGPPSPATELATAITSFGAATLTTSYAWYTFLFDSSYTLNAGTPYAIVARVITSDSSSNTVEVGIDASSPTHAGNSVSGVPTSWTASTSYDAIFEVYTTPAVSPTNVISFDSADLTDAAVTTNRLTGGTGSFQAGKVSEDGLVDDLGWSGNNYTELLYSITLKQADLADGDTLRFRVLRNGATTGITYSQYPTIAVTRTPPIPVGGDDLVGITDLDFEVEIFFSRDVSDVASMLRDGGGNNVLDIQSSFETDANSDGLADGWRVTTGVTPESAFQPPDAMSLVPTITGGYGALSQSITRSAGTKTALIVGSEIPVTPGLRVISRFAYDNKEAGSVSVGGGYFMYDRNHVFVNHNIASVSSAAGPGLRILNMLVPANVVYLRPGLSISSASTGTVVFDALQLHDRAVQGTLPPYDYVDPANRISITSGGQALTTAVESTVGVTDTVQIVLSPVVGRPKVWNGSTFQPEPGKVWNGSAWVEKPWKVWNGSSWDLA